jgi:predicted alpha/beta-fold hydrolase
VQLTGRLTEVRGATGLVLVVHGLGGSAMSPYAADAAHAATRAGLSSLRLNLRGADRRGEDFYHAGLTADLTAALASDELERYDDIFVIGYSLGGHVTLKLVTEPHDPRVRAVAAICPPIDLARSAKEIDRRRRAPYRHHVLRGLKEIYAEVAARRDVPIPLAEARAIRTLREWDERVVAPRHGFADAEDYWQSESVAPRLPSIDVRALVVQAEADPMVLADTVRPALARARHAVDVVWVEPRFGGHVGFAEDLDLGLGLPSHSSTSRGLEAQVVDWLLAERRPAFTPRT